MVTNGWIVVTVIAIGIPVRITFVQVMEMKMQKVDILQIKYVAIAGEGLEILIFGSSFFLNVYFKAIILK